MRKISLPISIVNMKIHNEEKKEVLSFSLEIGSTYKITHSKPDIQTSCTTFIKHYFDKLKEADSVLEDEDKMYKSLISFSCLPSLKNNLFTNIIDPSIEKALIKNQIKYNEGNKKSNYSSWIMPQIQRKPRGSKTDIGLFSSGNELPDKYKIELLTFLFLALQLPERNIKEEVNTIMKLINIEGKDANNILIYPKKKQLLNKDKVRRFTVQEKMLSTSNKDAKRTLNKKQASLTRFSTPDIRYKKIKFVPKDLIQPMVAAKPLVPDQRLVSYKSLKELQYKRPIRNLPRFSTADKQLKARTQNNVSVDELIINNPYSFVSMRTYKTLKPLANIEMLHKDYKHLEEHPINKGVHYLNQLITAAFKSKDNLNKELIAMLYKTLGVSLGKYKIEAQIFKDKEIVHEFKEKLHNNLCYKINQANKFIPQKIPQVKFYISTQNNGSLIKSLVRQRWWWTCANKREDVINFYWTDFCKKSFIQSLPSLLNSGIGKNLQVIYNHLECHYHLSNKKLLLYNMKEYYNAIGQNPFDTLPLTFHIKKGIHDPEYTEFLNHHNIKSIWIIKPGENSNRGIGIHLTRNLKDIQKFITYECKSQRTFIIQKYITNPLLINRRKFDIRMYGMITSINGLMKGYFYESGYIRTSSKEFTLKNLNDKIIHLTNDAIQQNNEEYGKYEPGNKLSFSEFQKYLDINYASLNIDFFRDILPQLKVSVGLRE